MKEKESISYADFERDCYKLSCALNESPIPVKRLVAITRGGLAPTCLLSQWLCIKEIYSISLEVLADESGSFVKCHTKPVVIDEPETVFIDDLYDKGRTYKYIKELFPKSRIGVVYKKTEKELDFPAILKPEDLDLFFPWEK